MYDIITIGGGLAGSTLAKAMAERGRKVLVLESTTEFKDRIRGEQLASWGCAEARELGVYDLLVAECANEMQWWDMFLGPSRIDHQDLTATTAAQLPNLGYYHPEMQETLLGAAIKAGAEVRRGARVTGIEPGSPVKVTVDYDDGRTEIIEAPFVAACDGRTSPARSWGEFEVNREPDRLQIAGVLFDGAKTDDNTAMLVMNPMKSAATVVFPQGGGRVRSYAVNWKAVAPQRFQGEKDLSAYRAQLTDVGLSPEIFAEATPAGPLATFDGADTWVAHPYNNGLALVGDAAAASDPSWGQGQPLTLRDVRELRDQLLEHDSPDQAGHAYATAHDAYFDTLRRFEDTITDLFYQPGAEANARRGKVLTAGPAGLPEMALLQSGPDNVPISGDFRQRVLG